MYLFDKDGHGAQEITNVLGMIGGVDFTKWAPVMPLATRRVAEVIGEDVLEAIHAIYMQGHSHIVTLTQQAIALFAWLRVIPTLDAQHDAAGRSRRLGESEKGLTAVQEFKDEDNIRTMAYEALETLVATLDRTKPDYWTASEACTRRHALLIPSKEDFDRYYHIGSHRLYITLMPIIDEVQQAVIMPLLGRQDTITIPAVRDAACRPLALLTIKKAVERLPVEVLPEGIVQVQQTGMVKDRLKAEQAARQSVANNLAADAAVYLQRLQDLVARIENEDAEVVADFYIRRPIAGSKGFTV